MLFQLSSKSLHSLYLGCLSQCEFLISYKWQNYSFSRLVEAPFIIKVLWVAHWSSLYYFKIRSFYNFIVSRMSSTDMENAGKTRFQDYIQKIAAGPRQSKDLTRDEAQDALTLILNERERVSWIKCRWSNKWDNVFFIIFFNPFIFFLW